MAEFYPDIQSLEATAVYDTFDGDVERSFDIVNVSVKNKADEVVWQKSISEVFILTGIRRPYFDRRLGKAVLRAHTLANRLNGVA